MLRTFLTRTSALMAAGARPISEEWSALAAKTLKGKAATTLQRGTPEGVTVQPIYTAADVREGTELELPGKFPYTRGVHATMCVREGEGA